MPEDEDSLGLESVFSLDDVLDGELAVVVDFSPHVVDEEGLGEVIFIVSEGHGLEVEGHQSTALNVSNHILASGRVRVRVEEFSNWGAVLGEVWAISALVPLLIVINNVVGCWSEELVELLVLKDGIEKSNFIEGGLSSLISDSCSSYEGEESEVDFPDECLVEHHEGEGSVANEAASPAIVRATQVLVDLVEIVSSTHSPFPEIILKEVVAEVELRGISLGFVLNTFH